jgi:hypothetical protein
LMAVVCGDKLVCAHIRSPLYSLPSCHG